MGKEQLIKECDLYFESVYQNVDTADTEGIITKTLEMLYGEGIWSTLNALADAKSEGRSYRRPNILECHERKVYDVNPEGTPPARSCKWCKSDKQDWRGIDTSYLEMTCDFCKDRGQDW